MPFVVPANLEAERYVLGAMLLDEDFAMLALSSLSEESFSDLDHRNVLVFRAIQELADRNEPVEYLTVIDQLITSQTIIEAGGQEYVYELTESQITPKNADHYINIVKEQALLRRFLDRTEAIKKEYEAGISDIGEFLTASSSDLQRIASERSVGDFKTAKEVADEVRRKLELESRRSNKGLTGVDTGYARLNKYTHGWQAGDLVIIAARPSVGKTAFAINLAVNAARKGDKTVAVFSCEMSAEQIMKRIISAESRVDSDRIQTGDLRPMDKERIASACENISRMKIEFDDTANPMLGDLVAKARKLKSAKPDLALIVIDYLNLITVEGHMESRVQEVARISMSLKELARSLEVPVIALAQLNRQVDQTNGEPNLSHLRESGSIEQDADQVIMMWRKDYNMAQPKADPRQNPGQPGAQRPTSYVDDLEAKVDKGKREGTSKGDISVVHLSLAKNRNGQRGKCVLLFSKAYSRFDDATMEMERDVASAEGYVLED